MISGRQDSLSSPGRTHASDRVEIHLFQEVQVSLPYFHQTHHLVHVNLVVGRSCVDVQRRGRGQSRAASTGSQRRRCSLPFSSGGSPPVGGAGDLGGSPARDGYGEETRTPARRRCSGASGRLGAPVGAEATGARGATNQLPERRRGRGISFRRVEEGGAAGGRRSCGGGRMRVTARVHEP